MELINKIRNMIKLARITIAQEDDGLDTIAQCEAMGKPSKVVLIYPYGFSANAPVDSTVAMLNAQGSGRNYLGIPTMPENRFGDLKEWEVQIGNYKTKASIFFGDDGNIRVENDNGYIELAENGQVNVNGNFTVDP